MLMKTADPTVRMQMLGLQVGIPPELVDRLGESGRDNLEAYVSGSADNTIASFRYDIVRWAAWAETNDVDPLRPCARDVRDFAKEMEPGLKPGTVKRMVSNACTLSGRIAGNASHVNSVLVTAEMKRQRRKKGTAHRQALAIRQKGEVLDVDAPAQPFSIERMLQVLEPDTSLSAARAKLLLSLGGDTGRRGGEYRAARWRDLMEVRDGGGGGLFLIPQSKTDQDGVGMAKFASTRTIRYRDEYRSKVLACGGDVSANAPLFMPIDRWSRCFSSRGEEGASLTTGGLIDILRRVVERTLLAQIRDHPELAADVATIVRGVSGHSFRVGLACDLVTAGESIAAVCTEGGWATAAMPVYYTRYISARTGASARLARRLGYA